MGFDPGAGHVHQCSHRHAPTDAERDTGCVVGQRLTGVPTLSLLLPALGQGAASVSFPICSSEFSPYKLLHWLSVLNVNANFTALLGSSLNTPNSWFLL